MAYTEQDIEKALYNLVNKAPIVRHYYGYIILAQNENDYQSKVLKIQRGDRSGFFTIECALSLYTDIDYWKKRCLLVEQCLKESPCDPDVTSSQIKAHDAYNKFLEIFGNKL